MTPSAALPELRWAFATLQKTSSKVLENEDALGANPSTGRFAVSDGASEGWQSRAWSRHLVAAYLKRTPSPVDFPRWLELVRKTWKPPTATGAAAWYTEAKSEEGSFATLLGVQFAPAKDGDGFSWKAVAVGDSCLVIARGDSLVTAWPIEAVNDFGNHPALIPSSSATACPAPDWLAGRTKPGDLFLLATDAAAAGLLRRASPSLWQAIRSAVAREIPGDRTAGLLELANEFRTLQNDDVTLLAITIPVPTDSLP